MKHYTRDLPLEDTMHMVSAGALALPEFQRDFVWDPSKVTELLQSVANGWPIGSLLLLEGPQDLNTRKIKDGPELDKSGVRLYLLDGQQRVTSLYHALTDTSKVVYYIDFSDANEYEPSPRIKWILRSKYDANAKNKFTIRELTNDGLFAKRTEPLSSVDERGLRRKRDDAVGHLRGGYSFSTIVMSRDIDLEALTSIFETLNRTGVTLNAFDLMVAVLYPHGFDLRKKWTEATDRYPSLDNFSVDGLEILKVIALWVWAQQRTGLGRREAPRKITGVRQRDVLALLPQEVSRHWDDAVIAYDRALRFLEKECGLRGSNLPSSAMVLTLTYLQEANVSESEILRWYWTSVLQQSYAQGANTLVLSEVARVIEGTPLTRDGIDFDALLRIGLAEPVRRNRILRMGLRGAAVVGGAQDPIPPHGRDLENDVVDSSLSELLAGRSKTPSNTLLRELVIVNQRTRSELIEAFSSGTTLDSNALTSQGIRADLAAKDLEQQDDVRVRVILSWIGEWL